MGCILVIATSKGGAGKTALTTCLAVNLAALGYRTAVVDADRNQAFATWHASAYDGPHPISCTSEISHHAIVEHVMDRATMHDVTLVDTAGFENQTAAFAMGCADLVLIPCMPDRNSAMEARKTVAQASSLSKIARRSIPSRVVLTRWRPRELAEQAVLEDLQEAGLEWLTQHLADATEFKKYTLTGVMPVSGRVGQQVDKIIRELVGLGALAPRPQRALGLKPPAGEAA